MTLDKIELIAMSLKKLYEAWNKKRMKIQISVLNLHWF